MALGTGHGVILSFLDPLVPGDPSGASPTSPGTDGSPLGTGPYLIRDLQLHEVTGDSVDLTHLRTPVFRRYRKPDIYSVGTISFNLLFDTEIVPILPSIPTSAVGAYNYPLPIPDDPITGWTVNSSPLGFFNGQGPVQITFPLRDSTSNWPATLGPINAWVTSRSYGNMETNAEHLCPVTMQFETEPSFNPERFNI